jgi:hypothetical protein
MNHKRKCPRKIIANVVAQNVSSSTAFVSRKGDIAKRAAVAPTATTILCTKAKDKSFSMARNSLSYSKVAGASAQNAFKSTVSATQTVRSAPPLANAKPARTSEGKMVSNGCKHI